MVMDVDRRYLGAAAILVLIVVFAGGMKYADFKNKKESPKEIISPATDVQQNQKKKQEDIIQVYVTGAVEKPGVYKLQPGARAGEALDMAHALPTADLKSINLAQKLDDGQAIIVPAIGEVLPVSGVNNGLSSGGSSSKLGGTGKININSASAQELDQLPGVGPALAQRIIEYRTSHGDFTKIEDINEVSGIGDKKFADLKDLITVR